MKDPLGIMGDETIFVLESYYSRDVLEEYENMDKTSRDSKKSMADLTKIGTGQFDVLFPPLFRKHLDSLDEMICFTARHAT